MQITVYSHFADCPEWHINRSMQGLPTEPTWTGDIEARDLEDIFMILQHDNPDHVEPISERYGYTLPSLSVGDVVLAGADYHIVASTGFHTISKEEFEAYKAIPARDKFMYQSKFLRSCNEHPIY